MKTSRPPVRISGPNGALPVTRRLLRHHLFELIRRSLPVAARSKTGVIMAERGRNHRWIRHLPRLPHRLLRERLRPPRAWTGYPAERTPDALRTAPGIPRDEDAATRAYREQPLHSFQATHPEALRFSRDFGWTWNCILPNLPGMLRGIEGVVRATARSSRVAARDRAEPAELTRLVKEKARALGLSAVGIAEYDPRYTFDEFRDDTVTHVIVVAMEQDWAATQTAPSGRAERAAFRGYADVLARVAPLAEFVHGLGFHARPQDFSGEAMAIHYGVAAGLGQLGLNGQLLTPQVGSRCRLGLVSTDAPLVPDGPQDYGIEKICDSCQACVRRCPVGAIPNARKAHRGIVKAKIKTERCYPTIIQTHGCSVCMKVCPVQRYGLDAVHRHHEATGGILGRDTDELEGYVWPLDGRFYGVGATPRVLPDLTRPEGFHFDRTRTRPPGA